MEKKNDESLVSVFRQSRLYGGLYVGDLLEHNGMRFPNNTWLQQKRRRDLVEEKEHSQTQEDQTEEAKGGRSSAN